MHHWLRGGRHPKNIYRHRATGLYYRNLHGEFYVCDYNGELTPTRSTCTKLRIKSGMVSNFILSHQA